MNEAMASFGNPSSIHQAGRRSRTLIEEARRKVGQALNCTARRVIFTGCGSESNNLAIKGAAFASQPGRNAVVTSLIEHDAVLNTCRWLGRHGFEVTYLPVDAYGIVDPAALDEAITGPDLSREHHRRQTTRQDRSSRLRNWPG